MDTAKLLDDRREAFRKRALLSSGISLLLGAASRLPTWEVASPVGWLVGTVNVGFLPIFGPAIVLGTFCFTYLALREAEDLRAIVVTNLKQAPPADRDLVLHLVDPGGVQGPSSRIWPVKIASFVEKVWVFVVPVIAYAILLGSFFDFVRPRVSDSLEWRYASRNEQVWDLLIGTGGWSGFRPITPAITEALNEKADVAQAEQKVRLTRLARTIPWIYPPMQTWVYLGGMGIQVLLAYAGWRESKSLPRVRLRRRPAS